MMKVRLIMLKNALRQYLSTLFYYLGCVSLWIGERIPDKHLTDNIEEYPKHFLDYIAYSFFSLYQFFMNLSHNIQGDSDHGPWENVKKD